MLAGSSVGSQELTWMLLLALHAGFAKGWTKAR
jgi:hypothetical protein